MYLIMDNTLSYQVKKIDTSNDDTLYKKWELTNIDDRTKTLSSGLNVYYLIEVKDIDSNIDNFKMYNEVVVNFSVKNKMYKVKQEIKYTLNFDY